MRDSYQKDLAFWFLEEQLNFARQLHSVAFHHDCMSSFTNDYQSPARGIDKSVKQVISHMQRSVNVPFCINDQHWLGQRDGIIKGLALCPVGAGVVTRTVRGPQNR